MLATIKLEIIANKASIQPPIGPILGQYGIPGMKFCQEFNDKTKEYEDELLLRVKILLNNKRIIKQDIIPHISKILERLSVKGNIEIEKIYELGNVLLKGNYINGPIITSNVYSLSLYEREDDIKKIEDLEKEQKLKILIKSLISSINSMNIKIIL